jgi:hypothetical protein
MMVEDETKIVGERKNLKGKEGSKERRREWNTSHTAPRFSA